LNIAEFSIRKQVVTVTLTLVLLVAGILAFMNLPRLEDPEFTIKEAIIATPYPGASAAEVEEEVTNVIEMACQELGQLWWIESTSKRGMSVVKARIRDKYDKTSLPQVWDELRRKVNDYQVKLPPGAGPSIVNDDFGDVYGVYLALTGEGYSYAELYAHAKMLRRELLLVQDVKKITLFAAQPEVIWVEMSRTKMAAMGISQQDVYRALSAKNLPVDAGRIGVGTDFIPINPTGEFKSEQEFGNLLISSRGGGDRLVYLRDVATVTRGYKDPPDNILRYDGKPAIGLGISTVQGGNVVTMGNAIDKRLVELENQTPVGMELNAISMQSEAVTKSINSFMINLIEAVAIVFLVLLFFMGLRSGLIIGGVLFLTICGTFLFMSFQGVILERISLGALIIALGMLVDNAIVVIDGMKVKIEAGEDRIKAAASVIGQTGFPLLGATVVAVLAFASIGTSPDSTGEFCRTLYQVILISLMLSWVTAVTATPLLGKWFLKGASKKKDGLPAKDPYAGKFFQLYRKGLFGAIKYRWITVTCVVGMFVLAMIGFGFIDSMFFPNSTRPQFFVRLYFPESMHIKDTEAEISKAEEFLKHIDGVTHVTSAIGGGDPRFLLTYGPQPASSGFGVLFVDVANYKDIDGMIPDVRAQLKSILPAAIVDVREFLLGPGEGGKIQIRLYGSDPVILRQMARTVKDIMYEEGAVAIRDDWKQMIKVVRPQLAEAQARRQGISRPALADALRAAFEGKTTGVYREGEDLLPIIARAPEGERRNVESINDLQIWSPVAQRMIPMSQVVNGFEITSENPIVQRRDRTTMLKIHCDPKEELSSILFARIKPKIEKALGADLGQYLGKSYSSDEEMYANLTASTIKVKYMGNIPIKGMPGYGFAWGGEMEDSAKAQASLARSLPIFAIMMILVVILLFNAIKQPLIIWLTVPLSVIGVTVGLLSFSQPFGFMALLGLMSLSGMLIKNAIVLIDQIDVEIKSGKERFQAVIDSGVSRMRPVMMAALTTILGMVPLLQDAFFISMAVTIMFGLLFATILTLIFVPVLYTIFFKIPTGKA
jgi:multidrug efflux pump subunit AcrB